MKFCILTDIHNNVIALEAILQAVHTEHFDGYLCAGDIIGIGPYPEQTVRRMMALPNLAAVQGNHDRYLTVGMPSYFPNPEGMDYTEMQHHCWEHRQLSETTAAFLKSLPLRRNLCVYGKTIAVMHYCMDKNGQYINYTPHPSPEQLAEMFSDIDADIIVYGHDHAPTILHHQEKWYINSGSLGCPGMEKNIARAAVLKILPDGSTDVHCLAVPYDAQSVTAEISRLQYPAFEQIQRFFFGLS